MQEKLDCYIANVFRYQTESKLYELFAGAWDLEMEYAALRGSQQTRELAIKRDDETLKDIENRSLNRRLVALGVIQVGGAIAAFVSIQGTDRPWAWPVVGLIMVVGVVLALIPTRANSRD